MAADPRAGDGSPFDADTGNPDDLYRVFEFGDLMRLIMLDTREAARAMQLNTAQLVAAYTGAPPQGPFPNDVDGDGKPRQLIGREQELWLKRQLRTADQPWQFIGNQVLMFYQNAPDINGTSVLSGQQKTALIALLDQLFGPGRAIKWRRLAPTGYPIRWRPMRGPVIRLHASGHSTRSQTPAIRSS